MKKFFKDLDSKTKILLVIFIFTVIIFSVIIGVVAHNGNENIKKLKMHNAQYNKDISELSRKYYSEAHSTDIDSSKSIYDSFSKVSVSGYYRTNSLSRYSFYIDTEKNNININGNVIFESKDIIKNIYLMKDSVASSDILIVITSKDDFSNLIIIDMDGNVVKEIKNINHASVNGFTIKYYVDESQDDYSEVYGYHTLSEYTLFYKGNLDFTSSGPKNSRDRVYSSSCVNSHDNKCLLYDNDGLKVESIVSSENDSDYTNLFINDNKVSFKYYGLEEIRRLDDDYLYVYLMSMGIGYDKKIYIIDFNGNIVNDLSDYVTNLGTEWSYLDDNIIVYKTNKLFDGPILACEYFEENNLSYDMNTFRSTKFKYLGSGKLKMIDDDFMTLKEYFDYYYHFDNCEDLLTAWNNGDFNY